MATQKFTVEISAPDSVSRETLIYWLSYGWEKAQDIAVRDGEFPLNDIEECLVQLSEIK